MDTVEVTLRVPSTIYRKIQERAREKHETTEEAVLKALTGTWLDDGLESNAEKRTFVAAAVEATDWWNAEGDRRWDRWSP